MAMDNVFTKEEFREVNDDLKKIWYDLNSDSVYEDFYCKERD